MGVGSTNTRVESIRKLMGAFLKNVLRIFVLVWVYVESLWDEKANGCKGKGFRTSFTTLFLDFWLKVGRTSCNRLV